MWVCPLSGWARDLRPKHASLLDACPRVELQQAVLDPMRARALDEWDDDDDDDNELPQCLEPGACNCKWGASTHQSSSRASPSQLCCLDPPA